MKGWLLWGLLSPLQPFGGVGPREGLGFWGGECDSAASSLLGVGVAWPSHSQESTVLTRSASASVESDIARAFARLGALLRAAPTLALPEPLFHVVGSLGKGDVVPTHGLVGRVPGLASRSLAPRPISGLVDEGTLAGALDAPPLPAGGLGDPGLGLRIATGAVGFARALRVTVYGLDESARARLAAAGSGLIVCGHAGPATGEQSRDRLLLSSDRSRSRDRN